MLLIEPFAGGAVVGLAALFEGYVSKVVISEIDPHVAAVWQTILSDDCEWLCRRILSFEVSEENVRAELGASVSRVRDVAFVTILRNRMQHGGILAPGASLMKSGEAGKGLRSRWYAQTIVKRIRAIRAESNKIEAICVDGLSLISHYRRRRKVAVFIDPPYTASKKSAGNRLYRYHELDHDKLFALASKYAGPLVMTYDNCEHVRKLAERHGLQYRGVAMKGRRHSLMTELVIGNDLSWMPDNAI